jgi:hypothetical protein
LSFSSRGHKYSKILDGKKTLQSPGGFISEYLTRIIPKLKRGGAILHQGYLTCYRQNKRREITKLKED